MCIRDSSEDDANKSKYWGKRVKYYKDGTMKERQIFSMEGDEIYKKTWHPNGRTKASLTRDRFSGKGIFVEYDEDGEIGISKISGDNNTIDPRTFIQKEGKYLTIYQEDFTSDTYQDFWEANSDNSRFVAGKGFVTSLSENEGFLKDLKFVDHYYYFETNVNLKFKSYSKKSYVGIIYNFVDGEHYSFFGINAEKQFCIYNRDGEDIKYEQAPAVSKAIHESGVGNDLKIESGDGKAYFYINGTPVAKANNEQSTSSFALYYSPGIKEVVLSEYNLSYLGVLMQYNETSADTDGALGNGTGFLIDERGFLVTNDHVIKDARYIEVEFNIDGIVKTYPAKVVARDEAKDLAIIRIISNDYDKINMLPYSIADQTIAVGSEVFTLGYPEALVTMGKEVKLTDGKISALSGFRNDKSVYQTTIPARGGNSGGAVFDRTGNIVGVLSSGLKDSNSYSYVIKSSVLLDFIRSFNKDIVTKRPKNLSGQALTTQVETLNNYMALVKIW